MTLNYPPPYLRLIYLPFPHFRNLSFIRLQAAIDAEEEELERSMAEKMDALRNMPEKRIEERLQERRKLSTIKEDTIRLRQESAAVQAAIKLEIERIDRQTAAERATNTASE